jgi:hypothetical protein
MTKTLNIEKFVTNKVIKTPSTPLKQQVLTTKVSTNQSTNNSDTTDEWYPNKIHNHKLGQHLLSIVRIKLRSTLPCLHWILEPKTDLRRDTGI